MLWTELLFALGFAMAITALVMWVFGWRHPARPGIGPAGMFLFSLLFVAVWAGGVWIAPHGPRAWGVPWIGFLVTGLVVAAIILAALPPPPPTRNRADAAQEAQEARKAEALFGSFFWIVMFVLLVFIALHYLSLGAAPVLAA